MNTVDIIFNKFYKIYEEQNLLIYSTYIHIYMYVYM